jgi:serine/threonine protein kinase
MVRVDPRADLLPTMPLGAGDDPADQEHATYGRFVSLGVIGRGGMGVVLRAKDPELDRNVAIKVLGPSWSADSTSAQRLQREAQAMAKLSHPNVVTVYEMGQVGTERFIAMELVEGTTLRRWLVEQTRPAREIVAAFVECGRGLAAAHAAGLVHRDFKPENVLIGADGRPRVTDFGLVAGGSTIPELADGSGVASGAPTTPLTVQGSVMGTPAYMAPEQWLGQEVDARTDQFAFCVALWEALFGERPFAGTSDRDVRASVLADQVRDPPRDRKAGRELEPVLRRGFAIDRAARWPSMTALLERLRPRRPRWPWVVSALGFAGAAVAVYALAVRSETDPCPDPTPRLATVWDAQVKARITSAFAAANPAVADAAIARITPALDRYATRWKDASLAACRATRVDGTQSAELLDRRMLCLDRRRGELGALTAALGKADHDRVAAAVDEVGALGDLDQCADRERLLAHAPPTDPELRRQVDALYAELEASFAARFDSKPAERQARTAAALTTARTLGYAPVLVRALELMHDAAEDNSDDKTRETTLRELAQAAAGTHDDAVSARAWINLIKILAKSRRIDEAKALEPVAEAAVARAGSPPGLRYSLFGALGTRRMYTQEFAEAIAAMRSAVEVADGDDRRASAQLALSQILSMKDGPEAALPVAEESLKTTEAAYGPTHPRTATGLAMIAQFLTEAGELDRAQQSLARALAIREAAFGPGHREVAYTLHLLGNLANHRGDKTAARAFFERAITNFEARGGAHEAGLSRGMLAAIIADKEGLAAARPVFEAALAGLATDGKEKINYISAELNFAERLIDAKLCSEAAPLIAHATSVLSTVNPRQMPWVLRSASRCDMAANKPGDAIAKLDEALAICKDAGCPPMLVTELMFTQGRTLYESGRDKARGKKVIAAARAMAVEQEDAELVTELDAWSKTHP